jgi:hypothetical protein
MNPRRDPDRLIHAFLSEGATELADEVYDTVRDRIDYTRQRAVIGPWREPDVNRYLKFAIAAAAVLAIAVVGYRQFGSVNDVGPAASVSPAPTATPAATPAPSVAVPSAPAEAGLPVGSTHVLIVGAGVKGTVTVPAPGWGGDGGIMVKNDNIDPPDGAGMIVFTGEDLFVYGDPCQWSSTRPDAPATTVDEVVAALTAQASRDATEPVDITVGGYAGKSITLRVPVDAAYSAGKFTDCDQGYFGSWTTQGSATPDRYHQGPGQIDELWILDVEGVLTVIDTAYYADTPVQDIEEMRAIVESATFE